MNMKRFLIFAFLLMPLAINARGYKLIMKEPVQREDCVYNDWSVVISFEWSEYKNYGITVNIKNESDSRIYVEWENARIEDEPICFGNDNSFTYRDRKADEVVHAGSTCKRFIARQSEMEIDGRELFYTKYVNAYGEAGCRDFIIPIRIGDEVRDYKFKLTVKKE